MEFEEDNSHVEPTPPEPSQPPVYGVGPQVPSAARPARKRTGWKIFWGVITALSILANIALFVMLIGVIAVFSAGRRHDVAEEVIQHGRRSNKIAVIDVQGIINAEQARNLYTQIKKAREDHRVKGLIVRVNSPGGTISASDEIHNEILKYRQETGKPVVAFMKGIAASGGYYTSVACDKIIAEPTTITGSVGVIAGYFVLQELLEGKLGIKPVIVKSGEKKDWPSSFREPSPEELEYLKDKLIMPAYERFVRIVDEGRPELTMADVKRLADGSIYGAEEALDEKLIDDIGYLDKAIEYVEELANIEEAHVVEYRKTFSWADILGSQSKNALKIDRSTLYEFSAPQVLYLWTGY